MTDRRVRKAGGLRFVRLTTGERISQCGRFFIRGPALTVGKHWRIWLRLDPLQGAGWTFPLYDTLRLQDALHAAAVFAAAVTSFKPRGAWVEDLTAAERAAFYRDVRRSGLVAIAEAEERGELGPVPTKRCDNPRQTTVPAT